MSDNSEKIEKEISITVPDSITPDRLDKYLASYNDLKLTRSRVQKLISDNYILVNGEVPTNKYSVNSGDVIKIKIPAPPPSKVNPENIPLEIIYEDQYLVVVNKPAGLVTHPGAGNRTGTLVNALLHQYGTLAAGSQSDRPGIVHRLDKNTSGLLVVARTDEIYQKLQKLIQTREIHRHYKAIICGHLKEEKGTINAPIGRSIKDRKKMIVTDVKSREAITEYKVIERYRSYDFVEVSLFTGRTHQIRVHFSYLGHPVFGDPEYGGREKWCRGMFAPERLLTRSLLDKLPRQALHAFRLEFDHPVTAEKMLLEAELPGDFSRVVEVLRSNE